MRHKPLCHSPSQRVACAQALLFGLDCKTVRIFAHSSMREQSNKRSEKIIKKKKLASHARRARKTLLRHALPISLLIFRKKPDCLQSNLGERSEPHENAGASGGAAEGPHLSRYPPACSQATETSNLVPPESSCVDVSAVISQDHAQLCNF